MHIDANTKNATNLDVTLESGRAQPSVGPSRAGGISVTALRAPNLVVAGHRPDRDRDADHQPRAVRWVSLDEARSLEALGCATILELNSRVRYDPYQHTWGDFVTNVTAGSIGYELEDEERALLDDVRREIVGRGMAMTCDEYERGLARGGRLVPVVDGRALLLSRAWASLLAAAWTSAGQVAREADWDVRYAQVHAAVAHVIEVDEGELTLAIHVLHAPESASRGRIFSYRRSLGIGGPAEMCFVEYEPGSRLGDAVATTDWQAVIELVLAAWRTGRGDIAS